MNYADLTSNQYAAYNRYSSTVKEKNITTLTYIKLIADSTNTDITSWNLIDIFGTKDPARDLISDKREINRRFFAHLKTIETPELGDLATREQLTQSLKQLAEARVMGSVAVLQENIDSSVRELDSLQNQYNTVYARFKSKKELLTKLTAIDGSQRNHNFFINQVLDIERAGIWKIHTVTDQVIEFHTARPITLKNINPAAGLNTVVNLGDFCLKLNLTNWQVVVTGLRNNVTCSQHIHPHVGSSGGMCWGTANDLISSAKKEENIAAVLGITSAILTTYNPDSPYVSLEQFKEAS